MFFEDIEEIWEYWGKPQYLTEDDFSELVLKHNHNAGRQNVNRQMTFGEKNNDRNSSSNNISTPYLNRERDSINEGENQRRGSQRTNSI